MGRVGTESAQKDGCPPLQGASSRSLSVPGLKVVAFRLERVVAFRRNQWSPSIGIGGRLRAETHLARGGAQRDLRSGCGPAHFGANHGVSRDKLTAQSRVIACDVTKERNRCRSWHEAA